MDNQEKELEILESIYESHDKVRQRDLARILGMSLGMTNAILKRLVQKGLLVMRKVNSRNILYIVSPAGVEAITRRSYRYLRRTIGNVARFRDSIEEMVREAKRKGFEGVLLIGASDLTFIVEHACSRQGVPMVKGDEESSGPILHVYSETYIPDQETKDLHPDGDVAFLQEVLQEA